MDQKQYDAMQVITQCSRVFAEQMEKCMENAGLTEKGFYLKVLIAPSESITHKTYSEVELCEFITVVGEEQYKKTCMEQFKLGKNDWSVRFDPKAKKGTVPELFGGKSKQDDCERMATVSEHPYPVDGFWISNRDDDPILGGGV